ncbi:3858_t:CDS:2 [Gigaspora margarita]|uniref:3858_t:CDS:1 n=1 Tax=Gigaspora margarita TaxID=4874 RepID=A0ABN7UYI5_GIGMA|nr:3858_t:CDS:2 [Gigaspora margarita]
MNKVQKYLEKYLKTHCPLQEKKDIKILDIREKDLTGSLDLTGFTNLETVICKNNKINSLDISRCPNLKMLDCSRNRLSSLNMTGLTNLLMLNCENNYLSSLKLTGCSNLQVLSCFNNYLTKLDFLNDLSSEKLSQLLIDNNSFINDNSTSFDLTPFSRALTAGIIDIRNCHFSDKCLFRPADKKSDNHFCNEVGEN